jgi:hypothetical protein
MHRDVYIQTHKGLLWTSTFTDNHICSHRYAWPCVWTQAHKQTYWQGWGILTPWLQKCSWSTGLTNICSHLHSFEELKPRQPSWTCFIPLFCTHFQMVKSTGWNLLSAFKRCQFSKLCLNPALLEGSLRRCFSLHCPFLVSRAVLSFCLPHHLVLKS